MGAKEYIIQVLEEKGGEMYMKDIVEEVSRRFGVSMSRIYSAIRELAVKGIVEVIEEGNKKKVRLSKER